jgi:hypothetical protein
MVTMSHPRRTPTAPAAPPAARFGSLIDWLALLMLLAGSILWGH